MKKYHVCLDFGGWERTYLFTAVSPEEVECIIKNRKKGLKS